MQSSLDAGALINGLSNKIRRRFDAFSARSTVSGAQGRILHYILAQNRDVFQKDIEEEFNLRPSTATGTLKLMEKNGFILRQPMPDDARLKKIIVTEKAAALHVQVSRDIHELERDLIRDIDPEKLTVFYEVIKKMSENLSD